MPEILMSELGNHDGSPRPRQCRSDQSDDEREKQLERKIKIGNCSCP